jgi:hypothetical protein
MLHITSVTEKIELKIFLGECMTGCVESYCLKGHIFSEQGSDNSKKSLPVIEAT